MAREDAFIIGKGFVGNATMKALDIQYYFDIKESNITLEEGSKKLYCFICLPTATEANGGQEKALKVIDDYVKQMKEYGNRNIFIIRSTVVPGTCKMLSQKYDVMVASNPETLSEKTWEEDAVNPRTIIIGADDVPTRNALVNIWKPRIKLNEKGTKIAMNKGFASHHGRQGLIVTDTVTAETLKYAFNTFFITKIVYANQMYDICEINGANYRIIRQALHQHPWGSKHHFRIIHKGGRGGGGHCFPKDIKLFAKYSNLPFFQKVEELNNEYLTKSKKE